MIGRLNHVAIAVRDIAKATAVYRDTLGAEVSGQVPQPEHGVTTVFINLPNTKIELLEPLGENSPIAKFLERNPDGGIHHVCYEVPDIRAARDALKAPGRAGTRRRRAENRRPWQAGAVPAPEGFLRHVGRTRTGVNEISHGRRHRHRDLFHHLVGGAVCGSAMGRAQPAGERRGRAGHRSGRAVGASRLDEALWTTLIASIIFAICYAALPLQFRAHRLADRNQRSAASLTTACPNS